MNRLSAQHRAHDHGVIADESVFNLRIAQRMLGRFVSVPTANEPTGASQQDLIADLFWSLYDYNPTTRANVPPQRQLNEALLNMLGERESFKQLREATAGKLMPSTFSVSANFAYLSSDKAIAELMKQQEKLNDALEKQAAAEQEQAQAEQDAAAAAAAGDQDAADAADERAQKARRSAAAQKGRATAAQAALDAGIEKLDAPSEYTERAIEHATRQAAEQASDAEEIGRAWGLYGGDAGIGNAKDIAEFAEFMRDPRTKRLAELAGRLKNITTSVKNSKPEKTDTIASMTHSHELDDILAEEVAKLLLDGPIGDLQLIDYLDRGLLAYDFFADRVDAGPFVLVGDRSGSMSGDAMLHMCGVGVGLALEAQANDRPFALGTFAGRGADIVSVTHESTPADILKWGSQHASGGTDFDTGLLWALDALDALGDDGDNADIVFLTDDQGNVSDETLARVQAMQEERGVRILFVSMLTWQDTGYSSNLRDAADHSAVWYVRNDDGVDQFLTEVAKWTR